MSSDTNMRMIARIEMWLRASRIQAGLVRVLVNGNDVALMDNNNGQTISGMLNRGGGPNVVSCFVDLLFVAAFSPRLAEAMVRSPWSVQAACEVVMNQMLNTTNLRVNVRPIRIPWPSHHLMNLADVEKQRGGIFQIPLRVLFVEPSRQVIVARKFSCVVCDGCPFPPDTTQDRLCARCGAAEAEDLNARHTIHEVVALVCVLGETIGDRTEQHQCRLVVRDDLLQSIYRPNVGHTLMVVACGSFVRSGTSSFHRILHALHVEMLSPSPLPPSLLDSREDRNYANWTARLCNNFVDSTFAETGSSSFFRTALLLSCVVAQSRSTVESVNLLVVGDVMHDTARMMQISSNLIGNHLRCCSAKDLIPMGLSLAQRGVCQIPDLLGAVASHPSAAKKVLEFLASHAADSCGTIWASAPVNGLDAASSSPLEKEVPSLAKSGLLRCFALVHRSTTPSLTSVLSSPAQTSEVNNECDLQALVEHVSIAVRYLDNTDHLVTTPAASALMDGFIRVSRTLRNTHQSEMSIHDIGVVFTMARAHAALCLKRSVTTEDALVAIFLLEESLLSRTGRSTLHFTRGLAGHKCNLDTYGTTPASQMAEFEKHVVRFLRSHRVFVDGEE